MILINIDMNKWKDLKRKNQKKLKMKVNKVIQNKSDKTIIFWVFVLCQSLLA